MRRIELKRARFVFACDGCTLSVVAGKRFYALLTKDKNHTPLRLRRLCYRCGRHELEVRRETEDGA